MRVNLYRVNSHKIVKTNWESLPYYQEHFTEWIKKTQGVYLLIKNREIVYVGVSIDLGSRIQTHINDNDKDFDFVFTLIDESMVMDIYTIESILINVLIPKYNKRVPKLKKQLGDYKNGITYDDAEYLNRFFNSRSNKITRFLKENKEMFKQLAEL